MSAGAATLEQAAIGHEERLAARARLRTRRTWSKRLRKNLWNVIGLIIFVVMVFPVYWMFRTSITPSNSLLEHPSRVFPRDFTLDQFERAINLDGFRSSMQNSLYIVSVTVLLALGLAFLAAVALAKFKFRGRKLLIITMIGVQMIPQPAIIIPLFWIMSRPGLPFNNIAGTQPREAVILTFLTFVLPFTVWTLRGFIIGIPRELEEAAMVDGSSRVGAFARILLPLVAPGLVATAVFAFVSSWNEFIFSYIFLDDKTQTATVWLAFIYSGTVTRATPWGEVMAASILVALPVVIFFLIVQRKIAFGLTSGAVKG